MQNTDLRIAIEKISKLYNIDILYADALVENIIINADYSDLPVEEILENILVNTSIVFQKVSPTQIVLFDKYQINSFDIVGKVSDANTGEKLPNADIWLADLNMGTSTNQEGKFVLLNVPVKEHSLKVDYIGYESITVPVSDKNLTPELELNLQQTILMSDSILIEGKNRELFRVEPEVSNYALSPMDFSDLPNIGDKDIFRSLQLMPGITTNANGASGVNIRGNSPYENLVLLDGMTLFHIDHSFGLLSSLNPDIIKDIRIYKGGFTAKYGGRTSGVMDLTSKSGDFNKFRFGVGITQLSGRATAEIPLAGKGAIFISGRKSYSSKLLDGLYNDLINNPPLLSTFDSKKYFAEYDFSLKKLTYYDLFSKITYLPSNNDVVTMSYFSGFDYVEVESDDNILIDDYSIQWGSNGISGKWYHCWNNHFETVFDISWSEYSIDSKKIISDDSTHFQDNYLNKLGNINGRIENTYKPNQFHKLVVGLEFEIPEEIYRFKYNVESIENSIDTNAVKKSVYVQDNWILNNRIDMNIGIRFTHYNLTDSYYFEPRILFNYQAYQEVSFKAAWGQYHQYILNYESNFYTYGVEPYWLLSGLNNSNPGFSEHYIAGLQWKNANYLFDVEIYYKKLKGLINELLMSNEDYFFLQRVQRDAYAKGFDLLLKKQTGSLSGWISYGYNQTRIKADAANHLSGYPASTELKHNLKFVSDYKYQNWNFMATYQLASGRPYTIPEMYEDILYSPDKLNQGSLPAIHQIDLSVSYRFSYKLLSGKLGLTILNVFDRKNIWYRHFYAKDNELKSKDIHMLGVTPTISLDLQIN